MRGILGEGREALARYAYTPYGETTLEEGLPLHVGFTGHLWEPETGQYFAPFRYYSPGNGRWLTRDPLGFVDGPNVYGYVGGKVVSFVDPMGTKNIFSDIINACIDWIWPTEDSNAKEQVKNATEVVTDIVQETITHDTPGMPPVFDAGLGPIEAAPGVVETGVRQIDKVNYVDAVLNGIDIDPPGHAGGDLPKEKNECSSR